MLIEPHEMCAREAEFYVLKSYVSLWVAGVIEKLM